MTSRPTIFISYSRDDHKAKYFVVSHLKLLQEHTELRFWHDQDMAGGDAWKTEIDRQLKQCVAAIILISRNSLTSEFILRTELKVMLERHHDDGLRIYPIVIENCLWKTYPWLVAMNVRPDRGDPLMRQAPGKRDDIMVAIGEEISDLLLNHSNEEESDGPAPTTEPSLSNGEDMLVSHQQRPASDSFPGLQDWGTPFTVDEQDNAPTHTENVRIIEPAPTPPALISIPEAPVWSDDLGIPVPDSFLLKPESRIVDFLPSAMGWLDEIFGWAYRQDRPLKLRLQAGAGGTGKTRLAIHVCETLASEGWFAGFLPASFDKDDVERDLHKLLAADRDCLFVIDYAETRADVVVTLARQLLIEVERGIGTDGAKKRYRIVMLAREGGDWFEQIAERATRTSDDKLKALLTAGETKSGPHRMSVRPIAMDERTRIFGNALCAFAAETGLSPDGITKPDLSLERFGRVLMIQMAALAALRREQTGDDQDLLDNTLGHERRYWRRLLDLDPDADDVQLKTFEQSLALFTLLSGRDSDGAAKDVIKRVPRLRNSGAEAELQMFDHLRRSYPNRTEDEALAPGIRGLEPDLLGERLVTDCLTWDSDLLDAALNRKHFASAADAASTFTVLARLAIQRDKDKNLLRLALDRYFADWPKEIVAVGKQTGGPIGELMVSATREADPKTRRLIVRQVKGDLSDETSNLGSFGIEVAEQLADSLRAGRGTRKLSRGDLKKLYSALVTLGERHDRSDKVREKAEVDGRALAVAEELAKNRKPDDLLRLAGAKISFSSSLSAVGQFTEALEQTNEAEAIVLPLEWHIQDREKWANTYIDVLSSQSKQLDNNGLFERALEKQKHALMMFRRLINTRTNDAKENEAWLYVRLSNAYRALGASEAAFDSALHAEEVSRELAESEPEDFAETRATALRQRSLQYSELGEFEEALTDAELAEALRAQLAKQQPDLHARGWANALSNLSLRRRDLSLFDEALTTARQAEFIDRDLADRQPEAYRFHWVINLANLGEALINTQDFDEAIEATQNAIDLLPTLEPRPGDDNQRIAPGFCRRVLAEARLGADDPTAALAVAEEGCVNLREAFTDRPNHVAEFYVQGLTTLAKCHRALGDDPSATRVLAEGIAGVTPLFLKRPRALQREMLRLIEPLDAIQPPAKTEYVSDDVRIELAKLPELPRGATGL